MSKITATIQTCTGDLIASKNFYKKLGYKALSEENPILFTDGKMLLEINPNRIARVGLKLYKENWQSEIEKLAKNYCRHSDRRRAYN